MTPGAPRIDIEPIYSALKAAIGNHWADYKEAVADFLQGKCNQPELSDRIDYFILLDHHRVHLHNQLVSAILGNAVREIPEPGVASWVSANDKPTVVTKTVAGDAAEQRLKREIMHLPARERHRLKAIQDEPVDPYTEMMIEYHAARTLKLPDITPTSAGGFNKTNVDLEIRKRYAQPLASETREFPDITTITPRLEPICYQEAIPGGYDNRCPELLNDALQTFIKEALESISNKVRSNGQSYIKTAKYKRQLEREEDLALSGEVRRNAVGLLPVELEAASKRRPLDVEDLRLAILLEDPFLATLPLAERRIIGGRYYHIDPEPQKLLLEARLNGIHKTELTNGINGHNDAMDIDELDWGWTGAAEADRDYLGSLLDDCIGDDM